MRRDPGDFRAEVRFSVVILLLMAVALVGLGYWYVSKRYSDSDVANHLMLSAAAQMKANAVAAFRAERAGDAMVISTEVKLMPAVRHVLQGTATSDERDNVAEWLAEIRRQYKYENTVLTGADGRLLSSAGPVRGTPAYFAGLAAKAANRSGKPVFEDIVPRGGDSGAPGINVDIPLRDEKGQYEGMVVLGVDPEHVLFPDLRDWPGAGRTGELMLVRRDGDSVQFLNASRLAPERTALTRLPLNAPGLPSARAVQGAQGPVDGADYRGQPVLAVARPVENSDWFVVAKVDRSEAIQQEDREAAQLVLLFTALLLLGGSVTLQILRRHRLRIYKEKYEAEMLRKQLIGRYDYLARFANDAIILWEGSGRVLEVNDRAVQMFGRTREELLRMNVRELRQSESEKDFDAFRAGLDEKESLLYEAIARRKDGSTFPVEISACSIAMEGRRYYQSIVRDISERKVAERQIRRLNRLYAVLSGCNAAAFRATSEVELFREACRVIANPGGFLIGWVGRVDPLTHLVIPVASEGKEASYLTEITISKDPGPLGSGPAGICAREGRVVASTDFYTDPELISWKVTAARHGIRSSACVPLMRQGKTKYVLGMYSSEPGFFDEEELDLAGEVGKSLSFALDRLTLEREREQAESERRSMSERLELALEASDEAYMDLDLVTGALYVSARHQEITGYTPDEARAGPTAVDMVHPDDQPAFEQRFNAMIRGELPSFAQEYRFRRKNGKYVWILAKAKVVERFEDGRARRIVGTRADITERKLLEQEFLQAQKMESIGRLAGGVAHDFNNYLTVINGYAALLREEVPPESPLARPLEEIREAGAKSATLTRQLLALGRKSVEHKEVLDVNSVLEGLRKILHRLMGENIELSLELTPGAGRVFADSSPLEQVILNLVVNARDAIQTHGAVTVSTASVTRNGRDYVMTTVRDNGCGISEEIRQNIFDPFFTTKDKSHGTGLGLATVYSVVHRSDGFIEIESEVGRGSAFHVFLPLVRAEPVAADPIPRTPISSGKHTIMVVEDQDSVRQLAAESLRKYGYRVLTAASGSDALDVSERFRGRIDLVITDVMMPGMNGVELVREIRKSRQLIKTLYISGYTGDALDLNALTGQGDLFLPKPFTPDKLAAHVVMLLRGDEGAAA